MLGRHFATPCFFRLAIRSLRRHPASRPNCRQFWATTFYRELQVTAIFKTLAKVIWQTYRIFLIAKSLIEKIIQRIHRHYFHDIRQD